MKTITKIVAGTAIVLGLGTTLVACSTDSEVASRNLNYAAESFEIQRTIVATDGITGQTMLYVEGRCSLETAESFLPGAVEIVCKYGPDDYWKHFYIKGDQDQLVVTQESGIDVSEYHTRIILKPQNAIPEFDIMLGEDE